MADTKEIYKDRYGSMVVPTPDVPDAATPNTSIPVTPATPANSPKAVAGVGIGGRADINYRQHKEATRADVERKMDDIADGREPGPDDNQHNVFKRLP